MKLEAIRALIDAATPGPWFNTSNGAATSVIATNPCKEHAHEPGHWIAEGSYDRGYDTSPDPWAKEESANFALIAASRTLLPKLLAVAEAAKSWTGPDHVCHSMGCSLCEALTALEADA